MSSIAGHPRCLLVSLLILMGADPLSDDPKLKVARERYEAAVAKIETNAELAKALEANKLLGAYRTSLELATKAGDFDKATAIKTEIESLDAGPAGGRPKNRVKFGGHSYALIPDLVTWHVAKKRCEAMRGHLVCIETSQENQFVLQLAGQDGVWLGASDEDEEGDWKWVNHAPVTDVGQRIVDRKLNNFNHIEHWLTALKGVWNDVPDGYRMKFVCEWDN